MKHRFSIIISSILSALILTGCSESSDPAPDTGQGGFHIRSRAISGSFGSRASTDHDLTHDTENINSWIVVFYKQAETNPDVATVEEVCRGTVTTPGMEFSFYPEKITDGTYDIAAFANIDEDVLKKAGILIENTDNSLSLEAIRNMSLNLENLPGEVGKYQVPMSGYRRNVKIVDKAESGTNYNGKTEVIEVIRLYAKVEIQLQNISEGPMTINRVDFGYVNEGAVPLFPDYDNLGKEGAPSTDPPAILQELTDGKVANDAKKKLDNIFSEEITLAKDESKEAVFYVRESVASTLTPNGRFYVTLAFTREGKTPEAHYADLADSFQWIQRNDHVLIRVPVSDVTMDWEVIAYPPIGGYPAVIKGENLTYTFSTPGKFSIRPIVKKGGVIVPSEYVTLNVSTSNDAIFKSKPERKNDEIIGEIGTKLGKATLTCTLKVKTAKNEEVERTQDITIIRQ